MSAVRRIIDIGLIVFIVLLAVAAFIFLRINGLSGKNNNIFIFIIVTILFLGLLAYLAYDDKVEVKVQDNKVCQSDTGVFIVNDDHKEHQIEKISCLQNVRHYGSREEWNTDLSMQDNHMRIFIPNFLTSGQENILPDNPKDLLYMIKTINFEDDENYNVSPFKECIVNYSTYRDNYFIFKYHTINFDSSVKQKNNIPIDKAYIPFEYKLDKERSEIYKQQIWRKFDNEEDMIIMFGTINDHVTSLIFEISVDMFRLIYRLSKSNEVKIWTLGQPIKSEYTIWPQYLDLRFVTDYNSFMIELLELM